MGKIQTKEQIIHKAEQEKKRRKAKSGKPNNNKLTYVDPINNPVSTLKMSFLDIPKDKWEKIFGSKNNKKKSDKKT